MEWSFFSPKACQNAKLYVEMTSYSVHFIVALALSAVIPLFFRNTLKRRLIAFLGAPVVLYLFFYNFDYGELGGVVPLVISYLGAIFSSTLALFAVSSHMMPWCVKSAPVSLIKIILSYFFACFCLCVIFALPWAVDTFPLSNVEAVLFTIFSGTNAGAENFVVSSLVEKVVLPVLRVFVFILVVQVALFFVLSGKKIFYEARLWKFKISLNQSNFSAFLWQCQKIVLMVLVPYASILFLVVPGIVSSAPFKAFFQQPIDSKFYREYYVHPDSVQIQSQGEPRNLIVIFLESMETNFSKHTPEIVDLEKLSLNFAPGGENVSGTTWTIAGITGKLCGIPLNMPMGINEHHGKRLPTYIPYAKCLTDVLADKGYDQLYIQGSSGDFTQKRKFWTVHGNVGIHDIEFYKSVGKIPEKYYEFWGFEDRKLYGFAKEELDSLAKREKPFAFYMLTVDTHQPYGYVDDSCKVALKNVGFEWSEDNQLPAALRCASMQLTSFVDWIKEQSWSDNTVVSVMGDHAAPLLSSKAELAPTDSLYWTNFIINSAFDSEAYQRERTYSSLDMFPTLLESMGFELDGRSIGLGRSLFADKPTLLEIYDKPVLDSLLRERSFQYDYFLMGK